MLIIVSQSLALQAKSTQWPNPFFPNENSFQYQDEKFNNSISPPTINLETAIIPVHYRDAATLLTFFKDNTLNWLSPAGHIFADTKTNTIFVRDRKEIIQTIRKFIYQYDLPGEQVLIKAQIVTVDQTFLHSLGSYFSSHHDDNASAGSTNSLNADANSVTIPIVKFKDGNFLDMQISALENQGHAKLISSPELIAMNKMPAMIESGQEIPYQESTYTGGTSVSFKKAALQLKVIPEIMPDHRILLRLTVNQDKVSSLVINGQPAITTQQLETNVLIKNQDTFVLGGIFEEENSQQQTAVPGLKKLPIVGILFQQNHRTNNRRELLIFITPKILHE